MSVWSIVLRWSIYQSDKLSDRLLWIPEVEWIDEKQQITFVPIKELEVWTTSETENRRKWVKATPILKMVPIFIIFSYRKAEIDWRQRRARFVTKIGSFLIHTSNKEKLSKNVSVIQRKFRFTIFSTINSYIHTFY